MIYQNHINPAQMSIYTLSNWTKDVVFFEMAHIASNDFYWSVNSKIKSLSEKWYILYFEWIDLDVDTQEVKDKIWILPTAETYNELSKALWNNIVVQDQNEILKNVNSAKNTDVKFSDLLANSDNKEVKKEILNDEMTGSFNPQDILTDELITKTEENNQEQEKNKDDDIEKIFKDSILTKEDSIISWVLQSFTRSFFNFSVKNSWVMLYIQSILLPTHSDFFSDKVIMIRNEKLAHNVISWTDQKIMITYWQQHFRWFLELLQKEDKNWKITKEDKIPVFNQ